MGIYKRGVVISGVVSLTMGNSPLPLAHRRLGDKEFVGKFLLGQPQPLPAAADIRAEGLFVFHMQPILCCGSCRCPRGASTIRHPGPKGKRFPPICPSTVRQVLFTRSFLLKIPQSCCIILGKIVKKIS